jgi:hypothetical protein
MAGKRGNPTVPKDDPQAWEAWQRVQGIDTGATSGSFRVTVLFRATPWDMATMPGMTVVFQTEGGRVWTMTVRNFCRVFAWDPHYEVSDPLAAKAPKTRAEGMNRGSLVK